MSLVFAAISPHPPLLIPSIGKEEIKKVEKTKMALQKMEEDLYLSKPECIVVISPHGSLFPDAFSLNVAPEFETDLRDFGDLTTKLKFKGEMNLAASIREAAENAGMPATMVSQKTVDHGVAVPLFYLSRHLSAVSVLPVGFSDLDAKTHVAFGEIVKDQIMNTNKRVAVIASADLSHALSSDAPAGFNANGAAFDAKMQELLSTGNAAGMLQLDKAFVESAAECGFRACLILMGIIKNMDYKYHMLAYEAPFGVGYLTANFML